MKAINYKKNNRGPACRQAGQVMMITMILFLAASLIAIFGIISPVIQHMRVSYNFGETKQSFYLSESGIEDALYRLTSGKQISSTYDISLGGFDTTVTTTNTSTGKKIVSSGNRNDFIRNTEIDLALGDGISFHYGIQAGNGGFLLQNSSSITGNAFSSGPVIGSGNLIYGDVISAGASGLVYGIHATGTVYAHNIGNSSQGTIVDKDAYYVTKTNTTINGTLHPGAADQPTAELPISDAQITEWETDAATGGTLDSSFCDNYSSSTNTCTISSSKSLGPIKIPFNVLVKSSSGVLTITGPIWITGNFSTQTGPTIKMSSLLGTQNVAIIADNPNDTTGSGLVDIGQTTSFQGSGSAGSYVFMISQNNSAETGGSTVAISMDQGASALVAYAAHGLITLSQSVSIKETTAYKIALSQSANVTYDTGLPSVLFQAGPSGGYDILSWKEN